MADSRKRTAGFSLSEVMIASALGTIVMAGVMSSFLMLSRSGARLVNYNTVSVESRRALEEFGQDVRMASNVIWNGTDSITLTVPGNYTATSNQVTYAYDSATTGATARSFYRVPGDGSAASGQYILARNVTACTFSRFDRLNNATAANNTTKRIGLTLTISATTGGTAAATETTQSASFVLRNKPAT
jgi:Tfp pilus assembly protein PilW